jgi:hypothetical protein
MYPAAGQTVCHDGCHRQASGAACGLVCVVRPLRQDVLVASAARDDWFRSPVWDGQIEAAFEQRLRRARPYHQPQYLRIQATHLLSSPDPRVREAGRGCFSA